jgi:aerobic carbon-monoxide dehydrogenase medium subunit
VEAAAVIPAPFAYGVAETAEHAVELLDAFGADARPLAGGQSLLPMMKRRLLTPAALIDIGRVPGLTGVRVDGDELWIGATTTHAALAASAYVRTDAPLLAHSVAQVGDPQVRHRGTIGGSVAHGDPAADVPMALVALSASVEVRGRHGTRRVPVEDFFTGCRQTVLRPLELVVAIRVPRRPGAAWAFQKIVRRANEPAIVAVAVCDGRIALANMGLTPLRARAVEQAVAAGAGPADAADLAVVGTDPVEDLYADVDYRRHLVRVLTRRALEHARTAPPHPGQEDHK